MRPSIGSSAQSGDNSFATPIVCPRAVIPATITTRQSPHCITTRGGRRTGDGIGVDGSGGGTSIAVTNRQSIPGNEFRSRRASGVVLLVRLTGETRTVDRGNPQVRRSILESRSRLEGNDKERERTDPVSKLMRNCWGGEPIVKLPAQTEQKSISANLQRE